MDTIKKTYFTAGEVATMVGVSYVTIHTWEKDLGLRPKRVRGNRKYNRDQVAELLQRARIRNKYKGMKYQELIEKITKFELAILNIRQNATIGDKWLLNTIKGL